MKSIAENVIKKLKEQKLKISGIEGESEGKWILLDTLDVVVHIFYEPLREFYDLEGLWINSPRLNLNLDEVIENIQGNTQGR